MNRKSLSFTEQPAFKELLQSFHWAATSGKAVNIICGAGVASDAGLPTWDNLVNRMCDLIDDSVRPDILKADTLSNLRKVDYIVRFSESRGHELHSLIHDALYAKPYSGTPGVLSQAIVDLALRLQVPVRLITTNFDNQLELALRVRLGKEASIESIGLPDVANDMEATRYGDARLRPAPKVLHIHGMIAPDLRVKEPVILSESYFLKFGPRVRDLLRLFLDDGATLFVGMGMADPNVVAPLSDLTSTNPENCHGHDEQPGEGRKIFLAAPVDTFGNFEFGEMLDYAYGKSGYYRDALHLQPIILKSYAQISQMLAEIQRYLEQPTLYESDVPKVSTRYGFRFQREMNSIYKNLGTSASKQFRPGLAQSTGISEKLYRALQGPNGPIVLRRHFVEEIGHRTLNDRGLDFADIDRICAEEKFALFLWLRIREADANPDRPYYSLQLVGASSVAHRDTWSMIAEPKMVTPDTKWPAVRAAFYGTRQLSNVGQTGGSTVWKSVFALPIRVTSEDASIEGPLDIGVATLNSTHHHYPKDEQITEKLLRKFGSPSALSLFSNDQIDRLASGLEYEVKTQISYRSIPWPAKAAVSYAEVVRLARVARGWRVGR